MNYIKEVREERGLTQPELAKKAKVSKGSMSEIENDKQIPGVYNALRIAKALQVTVEELFKEK